MTARDPGDVEDRIDAAAAAYRGLEGRERGIIRHQAPDWLLAGVVDGVGSWGCGMEAAEWTRESLLRRWSGVPSIITAADVAEDVAAAATALPASLRGDEMGCAFSVALLLLHGDALEVVAAGAYSVSMLTPGETTPLFRPHHWVDDAVARGQLTAEEAAGHPLHAVITGPFVADERGSRPEVMGPARVSATARVVVTEERLMGHYLSILATVRPVRASAIQDLAAHLGLPRVPVVVVQGAA